MRHMSFNVPRTGCFTLLQLILKPEYVTGPLVEFLELDEDFYAPITEWVKTRGQVPLDKMYADRLAPTHLNALELLRIWISDRLAADRASGQGEVYHIMFNSRSGGCLVWEDYHLDF